jgi:phage shock protein PspC (stress-responsive transcriptional regulator)
VYWITNNVLSTVSTAGIKAYLKANPQSVRVAWLCCAVCCASSPTVTNYFLCIEWCGVVADRWVLTSTWMR